MKVFSIATATLTAGLMVGTAANAGFIYHDSAVTDGGEFNASYVLTNLKNAGHTSHLDTEDASATNVSYATKNPPTGGYPVTITLDFNSAVELSKFYLWNHANNNTGQANGAETFSLTFFDGANATGTQIGTVFNGDATSAPASGTYAAQVFDFGTSYVGVQSVQFTIVDKINNVTSGFTAVREIGFEQVPEPSSLALLGLGGLLIARRRRG